MEAKVIGRNLPISTKESVEIGSFIRGKPLVKAKNRLKQVLNKKVAVPYKRYNWDTGHKAGIAAGRYPQSSTKHILDLLESLEKNAEHKGLNATNLIINYFSANKGPTSWHYGRKRRRRMKNTHVEIRVTEEVKK